MKTLKHIEDKMEDDLEDEVEVSVNDYRISYRDGSSPRHTIEGVSGFSESDHGLIYAFDKNEDVIAIINSIEFLNIIRIDK